MSDEEADESIPLADLRSELDEESEIDEETETDAEPGPKPATDDSRQSTTASEENVEESESRQDKSVEADDETASIPLSGLREEAERHERRKAGDDEVGEEAFVEESVEPVDSQSVWADLLMEGDDPEGHFEPIETEQGTQVISKRICERCQYVAEPPTLSCTHDGTTIHELVDVDHVRVSNCPMVGPDGEKKRQEGDIGEQEGETTSSDAESSSDDDSPEDA